MGMHGYLADYGCPHGVPVVVEVVPILSRVEPMPLAVLLMPPETLP
jgi:hypothetical protein